MLSKMPAHHSSAPNHVSARYNGTLAMRSRLPCPFDHKRFPARTIFPAQQFAIRISLHDAPHIRIEKTHPFYIFTWDKSRKFTFFTGEFLKYKCLPPLRDGKIKQARHPIHSRGAAHRLLVNTSASHYNRTQAAIAALIKQAHKRKAPPS